MNSPRPAALRLLAAVFALLLILPLALAPRPASATSVYLVPHTSYLIPRTSYLVPRPSLLAHPAPSVIHDFVVTLNKDSAEIWARFMVSPPLVPQVFRTVDTNNDGTASPAETQAWINHFAAGLQVAVDNQPQVVTVTRTSSLSQEQFLLSMREAVSVTLQSNYDLQPAAEHRFTLTDNSSYVGYDEYYITYPDAPGVIVTANDTTGPSTFEARFAVTDAAPATRPATPAPSAASQQSATPGWDLFFGRLGTFLHDPGANLGLGLALFILAMLVGGFHALTPGHGKAMVAAYLVGSRGRVWDAILLGGVVTFTHTISVVLLGVLLLLVNVLVLPAGYQAALELMSGVLIVGLGAWLLWTRWRELRAAPGPILPLGALQPAAGSPPGNMALVAAGGAPYSGQPFVHDEQALAYAHTHDEHMHSHAGHSHTHGDTPHTHDGHTHSHVPPPGASVRDLVGLGISGGLVPCPDAIGILLLAASVGQVGLGIALVGSFSIGLAFVLIMIGILLVTARGLLERLLPGAGGPGWLRWLPVASAVAVIGLGVLVILGALGGRWG